MIKTYVGYTQITQEGESRFKFRLVFLHCNDTNAKA